MAAPRASSAVHGPATARKRGFEFPILLDAGSALRAGDALHLACAEQAGAKGVATLDEVMARNAQRLKLKPVAFA